MSLLRKRLKELEDRHQPARPGRLVWKRAEQSHEEALAAAGLPADATNVQFFCWRAAQ